MILSAQGIHVVRGTRPVLENVTLVARPGEVLGLLGPNGAGKTTLLRVLAHLQETTAGTVLYDGETAATLGRRALGRGLAYLAQGGRIAWPMQVEHVVALGRLPHGTGPDLDAAAVARAMAAADVSVFAGRPTGSLSGGERMRVLLARALAVEGRILLADEPVAALDPYHQLHVMEVLRAEARAGRTVVVVLHDLTLAARFCDRVALLHDGRLIADGPPSEVMTAARLEATYGVRVENGERHGERFIIPWSRSKPPR